MGTLAVPISALALSRCLSVRELNDRRKIEAVRVHAKHHRKLSILPLQTLHKIFSKEPMSGRKCYNCRLNNKCWYQVFPI
jgi:hypothetical protein